MQSHYICTECSYISKLPGTCQNDMCIRQGTRLSECHCDDNEHDMVLKRQTSDEGEDPAAQKKEAEKNGYSVHMIDLDSDDSSGL